MTGHAKQTKPRLLRVVEKGFFPGWSSEQAHADILYRPATESRKEGIIFVRVYGQKKVGASGGRWYKPFFRRDAVERLLAYARRRHEEGYARNGPHRGKHHELKGHRKDLCEKCSGAPPQQESEQ